LHEGASVSVTKTLISPTAEGTFIAGRYRILAKLGEGGMGVVYKAEDTRLKRIVALKFMPPELTRDSEAKERFIREAQAAATLSHPNICTIHEVDEEDGQSFISMEYIEGQSVRERTKKGPLDVAEALGITIQAAQGLEEAHKKGASPIG
jgi:serine/threonine protein kinase